MAKLLTGTRVYGNATIDSTLTVANVAATGTLSSGANVIANNTTVFVGNSSVNTVITAGQVSISGIAVNSTSYPGTANNATNLGGVTAASYVQNTDSRTLSGNLVFTGANVFLQSASLGGTATNFVNNFIINTDVGNASHLRFHHYRHTTGADWTGTSTRIQQRIDVTNMGYLEFNPSSYPQGIGLYGASGSGLVVSQTGNVVTTTNTVTIGTASYFVSNGNVGIGTSSPGERLQVSGGNLSVLGATGSSFTGFVNQNNGASASAYRGLFYDARNENSIPVANMLVNVETDGSSSWSWSTTPAGSRTSDRRADRLKITSDGSILVGTGSTIGNGGQLQLYGYNAVGGTGYYGFLAIQNSYGSVTNGKKYFRLTSAGAIEVVNDAYTAVIFTLDNTGTTISSSSSRAPIFYDSDDINSYFEGSSLFMRGSAPTVYFRDTDNNSAMIHCNSNLLYILRGGNDTTSWTQVNSQWPCYFNLTNNDAVLGGSFNAVGNITAYYSDRRLKTNIKPITGAIDKLKQINGVYYKNNDFAKSVGYTDEDEQVGVISQEVEKVLPHVVKRAPFDIEYDEADRTKIKSKSGEDYKTVQYDRLVPLLIEAIKEQQVEIEKLKAAIAKKV